MARILKQAFEPLDWGTIRVIFCSKRGKRTVIELLSDEPMAEDIKVLFNKYAIFSKVGGMKSAEKRKSKKESQK